MKQAWTTIAVGICLALGGAAAGSGVGRAAVPADKDPRAAGDRYYQQGVKYTRARRFEQALEMFEKALPFKNSTSDIFFNLVMVTEQLKSWEKLHLYAQGFLYLEPDTDDAGAIRGKLKLATAKLKAAGKAPAPVAFRLEPAGVEVRVNYVPVAVAGGKPVTLVPGRYTVRAVKPEFHPFEEKVTVKKATADSAAQKVEGELKKMIFYGQLKFETTPAEGVTVLLDGKQVGTTPMEPMKLETRKYLVRFEKPGYDFWHRYVTVKRDETHTVKATLEKARPE